MHPMQYMQKLVGEEVSYRDIYIVCSPSRHVDNTEAAFLTKEEAEEYKKKGNGYYVSTLKCFAFTRDGKVLGYVNAVLMFQSVTLLDKELQVKAEGLSKLTEKEALALGFTP